MFSQELQLGVIAWSAYSNNVLKCWTRLNSNTLCVWVFGQTSFPPSDHATPRHGHIPTLFCFKQDFLKPAFNYPLVLYVIFRGARTWKKRLHRRMKPCMGAAAAHPRRHCGQNCYPPLVRPHESSMVCTSTAAPSSSLIITERNGEKSTSSTPNLPLNLEHGLHHVIDNNSFHHVHVVQLRTILG